MQIYSVFFKVLQLNRGVRELGFGQLGKQLNHDCCYSGATLVLVREDQRRAGVSSVAGIMATWAGAEYSSAAMQSVSSM